MNNGTDNRIYRVSGVFTIEATLSFSVFFFALYLFFQCFLWILFELKVNDSVFSAVNHMANAGYAERYYLKEDVDNMEFLYLPEIYLKLPVTLTDFNLVTAECAEDASVIIDVRYFITLKTILLPSFSIPVKQSFMIYPEVGEYDEDKLAAEKPQEEMDKEIYVYVTEHGSVYHTSLSCTYLRANVRVVDENGVRNERNLDGAKYYECEICKAEKHSGKVYISEYGNRYHYVSNCRAIKKNANRIKLTDTTLSPCSKCGSVK